MKIAALLVAAGKGERAGGGIPKQFQMIGGKALVRHAVESLARHDAISSVFVVIGDGQAEWLAGSLGDQPVARIVTGGAERQDSVRAGLASIDATGGYTHVLIHDAARPFVPIAVIDRLCDALATHAAAVPVLPIVDTLARGTNVLGDTVDRSALQRIQTPQAFALDAIMAAHAQWNGAPATDDAQIARAAGHDVVLVAGDSALEKITHAQDFAAAEARLSAARTVRSAMGFDVHRLETGPALWLGGVEIAHHQGLAGHSDADVALHALTDALLGTIGAGDIGSHFPPSDAQWRGAASHRFVEHARDLIAAQGGVIDHVDVTLICEAPKIGPYREAIRAAIASMLRIAPTHVSVKATTTERLGFAGRGEGIAAQAIATVRV